MAAAMMVEGTSAALPLVVPTRSPGPSPATVAPLPSVLIMQRFSDDDLLLLTADSVQVEFQQLRATMPTCDEAPALDAATADAPPPLPACGHVGRTRMAGRIVIYHAGNFILGVIGAVVAAIATGACVLLLPLCCIGVPVATVAVTALEHVAHVDLRCSNYIAQPHKRRRCRPFHDSLCAPLKAEHMRKLQVRPTLKLFAYFLVVKLALAYLSLTILLVVFVLPVTSAASHGENGVVIPGIGALNLLSLPSLVLRPFIALYTPSSSTAASFSGDDNGDAVAAAQDPILTYRSSPVAYVALSITVWVAAVLGLLLGARLSQRATNYFCPCLVKPKPKSKRNRNRDHSRTRTKTTNMETDIAILEARAV